MIKFFKKQKQQQKDNNDDDPFMECYAIVKGKMANRIPLSEVEEVMAENIRRFYAAIHDFEGKNNKK